MSDRPDPSLPRREFAKAAVALGGAGALAACLDRGGEAAVARGDPDAAPDRQHAWNEWLDRDDDGNVEPPRHHVLLYLDYPGGVPDADDREHVEAAFGTLERAYARGNDGLLVTVGYSPAYFDRFDDPLPDAVDLPEPEPLTDMEDPEFDRTDAVVHLASDHPQVLLAAEEALAGERDTLNGVEVTGDLAPLEEVDRRTGFVGAGLPAERQDVAGIPDSEPVPEDAPLFMGFRSSFERNQASEDRVTIDEGPFAGGTTQHVSKLRLQLQPWYEQDSHEQRVAKMFSPVHADEDLVGEVGEKLETDSGLTDEIIGSTEEMARERGVVGHTQKAARARVDGEPRILRRDFDSTDDDRAGVHFLANQATITDFVETRAAMTGADLAEGPGGVGSRLNNGILQYLFVQHRGNFLLPPRDLRALPPASP